MTTNRITDLITELEEDRKSKVIVYFTSDKQPNEHFGTQVHPEQLVYFRKILEEIKKTERITLVLDTRGGAIDMPWPLVNLIREYCKKFEVIILEKALSAGTLIALGADKIVMQPFSHLSPVDPATFIPDGNSSILKKLEIEDIIGFIDFAKEKVGIAEQSSLTEVMKELTKEVRPTLLGSVNRTYALIRKLARQLLSLHNGKLTEKQVNEITEHLTQKLYSHSYLINRKEAKEIIGFGNIIENSSENTKRISKDIMDYYREVMEIEKDFDPLYLLSEKETVDCKVVGAAIHSNTMRYSFSHKIRLTKIPDPAGRLNINFEILERKWSEEKI